MQVQVLQEEIRRGLNVATGDESEEDNEEEEIGQEGEGEGEREGEVLNQVEENFFRATNKFLKLHTIDVGVFLGNLKPKDLIDWIN